MSHHKGERTRLTLRMPKTLRVRLEREATLAGLDLNTYVERALLRAADKQECKPSPALTWSPPRYWSANT